MEITWSSIESFEFIVACVGNVLRRQRRRQSRSVCHACGGVFRGPAVHERNSHGIFENNKRCNDKIKNENGYRP